MRFASSALPAPAAAAPHPKVAALRMKDPIHQPIADEAQVDTMLTTIAPLKYQLKKAADEADSVDRGIIAMRPTAHPA